MSKVNFEMSSATAANETLLDTECHDVGIQFEHVKDADLEQMRSLCEIMTTQQERMISSSPELAPTKNPQVFVPPVFLVESLSVDQASYVNEHETPRIALHCVQVQREIAKVPIVECGERLEHLPTVFQAADVSASFSHEPFPSIAGEWAGKPQEFWTRHSMARRLVLAAHILSVVNAELHFIEAFRPGGVQEAMFKRRVQLTAKEHPNWSSIDVVAESKSKTASAPRLASHMAGAAVDMFLRSKSDGKLLDFGHNYPDGGAVVFPKTRFVTKEQWLNRQMLKVAANLAGLVMYVGEDWHFSFGDNSAVIDGEITAPEGIVARYGPIKDFDHRTGEITAFYDPSELDQTFPTSP